MSCSREGLVDLLAMRNKVAYSPFVRSATGVGSTPARRRLVLTGQQNIALTVFTFGKMSHKSEEGELPPVASLSAPYQKFIGTPNHVPPLAGKVFLSRWGQKTAAELIARFQITASDPFFQFQDMNDEAVVNITAYVLQMNGASRVASR